MSEENRREIQTPTGTVRLTEEAWKEEAPTPEMQELARSTAAQSRREREERENAGKISVEKIQRGRGEREIEEYRRVQLALWKNNGGTAEEFASNWPRIKAERVSSESRRALDRAASSSPY